eukprot:gene16688-18382_t
MSADRIQNIRERSKIRRQLLAQQLGAKDVNDIGTLLGGQEDFKKVEDGNEKQVKSPPAKKRIDSKSRSKSSSNEKELESKESDEEAFEELYTDSSTFLKGTQSLNPHNDYCQHFLDTLQRPQNFIRDTGLFDRFEEYPKLKELIRLKDEIISKRATPPMYLQADLETFDLRELKSVFDVILIDPPLEEYQRRCPGRTFNWRPWEWDEIMKLEIGEVAAQRSFVFLWCGSAEGLNQGRKCLRAWGFRRCEDICWIKTNKKDPGNVKYMEPKAVLQHTKEHCLMGIKGTVRRSTDFDFIHANVDLDIIITEEPEFGSTEKPEEIFHILEHFCLGRRRLHVFGNDSTLRPGWLTVGPDLSSSNFSVETYINYFNNGPDDYLVGSSNEIETLRPKSPPAKSKNQAFRGRGGGPGRGGTSGRGLDIPVNMPPGQGSNLPLVGGARGSIRGGMNAAAMQQRNMIPGGGFITRGGYQPR